MKTRKIECSNCGIWFERRDRGNTDFNQYLTHFCSKDCFSDYKRTRSKEIRTCEHCYTGFTPTSTRQRFCSRACSAASNNTGRSARKERPCLRCGEQTRSSKLKYCNNECKTMHQLEQWLSGEAVPSNKWCSVPEFMRRYLIGKSWYQCSQCGWAEIHPVTGKVPLQVDHIDGDCSNNRVENLRVLCPNCHSLTPTFGSLNSESKREAKNRNRQKK